MGSELTTIEKTENLLAVPDLFKETALSFPSKVEQALALITDTDDAIDFLAKAEAMECFAKRIKADTETTNAIAIGTLLIKAKLGELMRAKSKSESGKSGGRGHKASKAPLPAFSQPTITTFRKLEKHKSSFPEYTEKVDSHNTENPNDVIDISTSGFLSYVGSDGNLKSAQNKGVIEWYTPAKYIEAVRSVMGSIDLDPASSKKANKVVKAKTHYTQNTDGLAKQWTGNVFMNPPFKASLIKEFTEKLCGHYKAGDVTQAIVLTNNNTDTKWWHQLLSSSSGVCFTLGRIAFYSPVGEEASPTNGHTLFYMGGNLDGFCDGFGQFGAILTSR